MLAASGQRRLTGLVYAVGPAKGFYEFSTGKPEWKEPEGVNTHLDVLITDAHDGRFIPGLSV